MTFLRFYFYSVVTLLALTLLSPAAAASTPESGLIQQGSVVDLGAPSGSIAREPAIMRESPDGRFVYVSSLTSRTIDVFERDADSGVLLFREQAVIPTLGAVNDFLFLAEGRVVVFANYTSGRLHLFTRNSETGALTYERDVVTGSSYSVWGLAKSPDERVLYVIEDLNKVIRVFSFAEDTLDLQQLSTHTKPSIGAASFLPSSRNFTQVSKSGSHLYMAASSASSIAVYAIDSTTQVLATRVDYQTPGVNPLTIILSPDERQLYVGSGDLGVEFSSLHVFDVDTASGTLSNFRTVEAPGVNLQSLNSLAISPDGRNVFAGSTINSAEGGVKWFTRDTTTGDLTFVLDINNNTDEIEGFAPIWALLASADGRNWYATSGNGVSSGTVLSKFFAFSLNSISLTVGETALRFVPGEAVSVVPDLTIALNQVETIDRVIVEISSGFEVGDLVSFTSNSGISGISGVYDASTGELDLSGVASAAEYETVLRSLMFTAASGGNTTREVTIYATAGDVRSNDLVVNLTVPSYTVRFLDWDGSVLSSSTVDWGSAAVAPSAPRRERYTFEGWDADFSEVTADLDVTAVYAINTFTVRFLDWDGTELSSQSVERDAAAVAPSVPGRDGYSFTGWDTDFSAVTEDLDVTAVYEINTFTVRFFNWDGRLLDTQTVDWNSAAVEPVTPEREGYDFAGWDVAIDTVTADIDATATFTIKVFRVEFLNDDAGILSIQNVIWRQAAVPPISPSKEGYHFVGWDKPYDSITEDIIIYAEYERIMLTVKAEVLDAFGVDLITPASQQVEYNGDVEFHAHVGARYRVKSVSTDCGVDIDVERVIYSLSGITESCKVEFEYERRPTSILHLLLGADPQQGSGAKP